MKVLAEDNPIDALARIKSSGLTLTEPNDLYWMVRHLKEEFYQKGKYYYPMKTICDGQLIETEFYCPFEPNLSTHYAELFNTRDKRSELYAVAPNKTNMKKYNRINLEKIGALMTPTSTYEETELTGLMYSMMYYLNDQTAHLKLSKEEIQPELVDELNDHVLLYLGLFLDIFEPRDPQDLERIWDFLEFYQPYFKKCKGKIVLKEKYRGHTPPQIALVKKITGYISKNFAPTKNITQYIFEIVRYVKGIKEEIKIRSDKNFTLTLEEYDAFRDTVTTSPIAHTITDMTFENFCYSLYLNPLFTELEDRTSEIITYFNDVCTCDRERRDNDPFNALFILREDKSLNYPQSCDLVVMHAFNKMNRFLELKKILIEEAVTEEEKEAVKQMIHTRENTLIGYVCHEICCVTNGYARDHKPLMKEYLEGKISAKLVKMISTTA
nr:RadA2 [Chondria armata]UJI64975.1 RadA3 [Chondria armata]